MSDKGIERRLCQRFKIPGATISYTRQKLLFSPKGFDEEFCPVLDISRGGVRFLTQKPLKFKAKVVLQISIPGERIPLNLKGHIRWSSFNPGKSYKYQAGVQFNAYGEKKGPELSRLAGEDHRPRAEVHRARRGDSPGNKSEFSI